MNVLVTGAGGQVGQALTERAPTHHNVVAYSRTELDISNASAVRSCIRQHHIEVIINAAAYTAVDRAEDEPESAQRANADAPLLLAKTARDCDARLLHISTDFVFDGAASRPYSADFPPNPLNTYGRTKRAGEVAILEAYPAGSIIVRTSWVYGSVGQNFALTMLRVLKEKRQARVVSDQIGTPTWSRSLAKVLWRIVDHPQLCGIHHWTDAGVASWYDFAVAIAEEASLANLLAPDAQVTPIRTCEYVTRARRPSYSVLETTSLTCLGITPQHWRTGLRAAIAEINNG